MAKETKIKTLEEALEAIETLEAEKSEQAEIITDLRAQLSASTKVVAAKQQIVKLKNKKYKVNAASFHFNGKKYNASDVESNSQLLKELVDIGAGFIEEVE